jgi:hypothetical protein
MYLEYERGTSQFRVSIFRVLIISGRSDEVDHSPASGRRGRREAVWFAILRRRFGLSSSFLKYKTQSLPQT